MKSNSGCSFSVFARVKRMCSSVIEGQVNESISSDLVGLDGMSQLNELVTYHSLLPRPGGFLSAILY